MWHSTNKLVQTFNMATQAAQLFQYTFDFLKEQGYGEQLAYWVATKNIDSAAPTQQDWQEFWGSEQAWKINQSIRDFNGYLRTTEALQQVQDIKQKFDYQEVIFIPVYFRQQAQGVLVIANQEQLRLTTYPEAQSQLILIANLLAAHLLQLKNTTNGTATKKITPDGFAHLKVLVVEDVLSYQIIISKLLTNAGVQFEVAGTGKAAIEKLQQKQFDLVLLDIQLPDIDGFDVAKFIREQQQNKDLFVATMTAEISDRIQETVQELGLNAVLTKPVNQAKLQEILKELAGKQPIKEELNLDFLVVAANNNPTFIQNMLKMTLVEFKQFEVQFLEVWQQQDLETIKRLRHKIKPHLETYQLNTFHKQLNTLVENAEKNNFEQVALLELFKQEMATICKKINEKITI